LAGGPERHSVDRALDVLAAGLLPHDVVITHQFPLEEYRNAVETAIHRDDSHAIKVVFRPEGIVFPPEEGVHHSGG
jgi:L-iditol 2-dehydrogenase